jgi:DNA-binding GntR family transcriptional regulator
MAQRAGRTPAKYRQIAADLRARIERGEYPVGAQLPTKPELEGQYGAALGTVDRALGVLRDLGIAESRQGVGTFVLRQLAEDAGQQDLKALGEQVAGLQRRVDSVDDADLREIVSRIEGNLIELYGKTGFDYPADETGSSRQQRREGTARHG